MDPSGFDDPPDALVDAGVAARMLGVKVATLYSYASRGRVRAFPSERHREKRYLRTDLERLRSRADARLG
ncbi:MAG: helix-turn-helix domain-containing protein, partial [Myxococcaceae bacterium]